jgi:hypothetical protein
MSDPVETIARAIVAELCRQGADEARWSNGIDYVDDSEGLDRVETAGCVDMLAVARAVLNVTERLKNT